MLLGLVIRKNFRLRSARTGVLLLLVAPFGYAAAPNIQIPRIDTPPKLANFEAMAYRRKVPAILPIVRVG